MPKPPVPERIRVRLELRRSNAAVPHRNRKREFKRPGKGHRAAWKQNRRAAVEAAG